MSHPVIHVVRDRTTPVLIPADGREHRLARYGEGFSGLAAGGAILHDEPQTDDERLWVNDTLACRMVPGAMIVPGWDTTEPRQ